MRSGWWLEVHGQGTFTSTHRRSSEQGPREECDNFAPKFRPPVMQQAESSKTPTKPWCAREDLNLHPLRDQILSLACLPFHHARNPDDGKDATPTFKLKPRFPIGNTAACSAKKRGTNPALEVGRQSASVGLFLGVDELAHLENRQEHTNRDATNGDAQKYDENRLNQGCQARQCGLDLLVEVI